MQYLSLKENIGSYFQGNKKLSKEQLVSEIRKNYPRLANNTIRIYLSRLKKEGVLYTVSRGVYKIESSKLFQPFVSKFLKQTHNKIKTAFPYINFCVGNTSWLNDFMLHQPLKNYTYIETEKDATESVFNFLIKQKTKVLLYADKELIHRYLIDSQNILIVKNLVSESPLTDVSGIAVPSLEKMLVDMLIDVELFSAQQAEKELIIQNAFATFTINKSKMQRYAQRRNKKTELNTLMNICLAKYV